MNKKFDLASDLKVKILNIDIGQMNGIHSPSISIEDMQEMIPRFPQADYYHNRVKLFHRRTYRSLFVR